MSRRPRKTRFDAIMRLATDVAAENPSALPHMIKALGRKRQAEAIIAILASKADNPSDEFSIDDLWFDQKKTLPSVGLPAERLSIDSEQMHQVNLAYDLVMPTPWNRQRIYRALIEHGVEGKRGAWRQDRNHYVELWLPHRIAWVRNGYHSISAGIIRSEGVVVTKGVVDLAPLLSQVCTDGKFFFELKTGNPISEVRDAEWAAIFEIGKLMLPSSLSFKANGPNGPPI